MKKIEVFTWGDMDLLHRQLAEQVKASNFHPDIIVGIQRCGLIPAVHLAYLLEMRDVESIQVITTENDGVNPDRELDAVINFAPKIPIEDKRILLVDTVIDTGTTVNLCIHELKKYNAKEIRVATVSDWPNSQYSLKFGNSRPKIDYFAVKSKDWPDFPWEH